MKNIATQAILLKDLRAHNAPKWLILKAQRLHYAETDPPVSVAVNPYLELQNDLRKAKLDVIIPHVLAQKYS